MEIIKSIKGIDCFKEENDCTNYGGYFIETDKQIIKVGIDMQQDCCETADYIISEDDLEYFIGSELLDIKKSESPIGNNLKSEDLDELDAGGSMFMDFYTSKGVFQFACYNSHSRYYIKFKTK